MLMMEQCKFVLVRMVLLVLDSATSYVGFSAFSVNVVVVVLEIRKRNVFPTNLIRWIEQFLNRVGIHRPLLFWRQG